jgi:ABC-type xylose transport system permease subunit
MAHATPDTTASATAQAAPAEGATPGLWARLSSGQAKQKLLAFASLLALILIFTALKPEAFMTQDNIIGILQSTTVIGVLAIASPPASICRWAC